MDATLLQPANAANTWMAEYVVTRIDPREDRPFVGPAQYRYSSLDLEWSDVVRLLTRPDVRILSLGIDR